MANERPWRAAVAEGSMQPAIEPGDWLLLDPTSRRWPRRGSIVVIREPGSDLLAIKRVAGRPGDWIRHSHAGEGEGGGRPEAEEGGLRLGRDEAWLLGDNAPVSVDSRRYGPVGLDRLVARAWFRYWPPRRIGRLASR